MRVDGAPTVDLKIGRGNDVKWASFHLGINYQFVCLHKDNLAWV